MADTKKIYFISDIHLGAPALTNNKARELMFVKWLDFIKPDVGQLFLLGDIFDFWFEYKKVVPKGYTRVLGRLSDLTDSGVQIHFFTGNHDLWVFDYLPEETGIIVHTKEFITEISGKRFYMAHGDGLDPNEKGYLFLKKIFTNPLSQWIFAQLHPDLAFRLAQGWSKSSRLSKSEDEVEVRVKNESLYKFAESFLNNNKIDYFIFGHRHRMADIEMGEKSKMILLGDWINYFSYGVFDGANFELKQFINQ